jgi:hypothetical protein
MMRIRPDPDPQNRIIKCTHLTFWIYLCEGPGSTHAFQFPQLSHAVQDLPENRTNQDAGRQKHTGNNDLVPLGCASLHFFTI